MTVTVTAEELAYIDPKAGNDKYYRVYHAGTTAIIQYGRNGTAGTTSRTICNDPAAALAVVTKKRNEKFKKGYEPVKAVTLTFDHDPTDLELDTAFNRATHKPDSVLGDATQTRTASATVAAAVADLAATPTDPAVLPRVRNILADYGPVTVTIDHVRPMLATGISRDNVSAYLHGPDWVAQHKLDGDRFVIDVNNGDVTVYNRQGQPKTSNIAAAALDPFRNLTDGHWMFDGEIVGRKLWLFDIIAADTHMAADAPYHIRHDILTRIIGALAPNPDDVEIVATISGADNKNTLLATIVAENREGIIFRNIHSPYQPGRRSTDLIKYKLIREADCVVTAVGTGAKQNATLAVTDHDGTLRTVGSVSTIGKGTIAVGDIVEVQYLYVVDGNNPRMFQPRILRRRHDKTANDCHINQFANATTNKTL
jgi:predicted DNA-binding WGR domain protein